MAVLAVGAVGTIKYTSPGKSCSTHPDKHSIRAAFPTISIFPRIFPGDPTFTKNACLKPWKVEERPHLEDGDRVSWGR
jgi:hypothetical protein